MVEFREGIVNLNFIPIGVSIGSAIAFFASLIMGRTRGWPLAARRSEKPVRYWAGMTVFGVLAAFFGYLAAISLR